ncbi:MAG: hypothetical protein A3I07_02700 [Candidatus Doudnabacteria bacterium RIFCSPLOWO2_02_FULL_42_9]|uniref:Uncharacterized protein n=1 Tax=Candidatus Doudnabacteria bacterium RIFCSPHIGHO2_01_FULL_41_86 TaxID=1817821 RepID=A0A1F5N9J2_9BACT|nr:MAG: hypothetical protein A2717_02230 [Candidatus Doudnabacteria bacterium RIFCSPHIGHO2_01_FULL_41_86]OGE75579.1 MAG: hypothetical protein A3K07_01985 [Candidatus Doudnabacteria bacterium RIFCSPHIGHO2_01_43_10]OGE85375.1 MAG: hypothetical protein A3E28_01800 [Candidatus Doudnabacteria bacterium RIFCSPHIGHO2_12_FULL_42_22]OGE86913.1 MAG: hypothetical protein A3C49_02635 [Candidatus Doudnabacteria bacterium RIFCSPHIGHO2_02_FULL_42_25]OGE92512.1 MAG: hypothetical protein A2895_02790 [Candidatus
MAKANFKIDGKEVTVFFDIVDGRPAPCFYCHDEGAVEQHMRVDEVDVDGVNIDIGNPLHYAAETRVKQLMFSGRSLHIGSPCEDKWIAEFHAHRDAVIVTP